MYLTEIVSFSLIVMLCVICTKTDICEGMIYNKILIAFAIIAGFIDFIYYGIFVNDLLFDFFSNLLIIIVISMYLFYSHTFAGGDCKMIIVLSLLYPARWYLVYRSSILTLFFSIGIAILVGYIYLLVSSIKAIVTRKVDITFRYIQKIFLNFFKSYISALVYIVFLNSVLVLCDRLGFAINVWISRCICMMIAYVVGRYSIFKKMCFLVPTTIVAIVLSLIAYTIPISLNPESYMLVFILLICQMTIRTTIYEKVRVDQLRKGMILTTLSSILMQNSITKGLPGVSTEDLKSRLTLDEIESIRVWAKATHTEELTVVKKIPFAIFISIGFISYFVIGGILT